MNMNNKILALLGTLSQSEVSRIIGITRQRVNQIVKKLDNYKKRIYLTQQKKYNKIKLK